MLWELERSLSLVTIAGIIGACVGVIVVPIASRFFAYAVTRARFPRVVAFAMIGGWIGYLIAVTMGYYFTEELAVISLANVGLLLAFAFKRSSRYQKLLAIAIAVGTSAMLIWNSCVTYENYVDPQGDAIPDPVIDCEKTELRPVGNTSGLIVTAHRTICNNGGAFGTGTINVYVYLHPLDKPENRNCLIFRYDDEDGPENPQIIWKNDRELLIRVRHIDATKMLTSLNGVKIAYTWHKHDRLHEPFDP